MVYRYLVIYVAEDGNPYIEYQFKYEMEADDMIQKLYRKYKNNREVCDRYYILDINTDNTNTLMDITLSDSDLD